MKIIVSLFSLLIFAQLAIAQRTYRPTAHEIPSQNNITIWFFWGRGCDVEEHYAIYTHPLDTPKNQHYYFQKYYQGKGVWDGFQKITVNKSKIKIELNPEAQQLFETKMIEMPLIEWKKEYSYHDFKNHLKKIFAGIENVLYFE